MLTLCNFQINRRHYPTPKLLLNDGYTQVQKLELIEEAVCCFYGVTKKEISSESRVKKIAFARHIAATLIYCNCTTFSVKSIGVYFGNRHHTTILNSLSVVKCQVELFTDNQIKDDYTNILDLLPFNVMPLHYRQKENPYYYN